MQLQVSLDFITLVGHFESSWEMQYCSLDMKAVDGAESKKGLVGA